MVEKFDRFDQTIREEESHTIRDKRAHSRFQLWFPVTLVVGRKQVWAVCRDASAGGMRVSSAARAKVGTPVTVRFRVSPSETVDRTATGKILRVESPAEDSDGAWPHEIAVVFDEAIEELAVAFQARISEPPGPDSVVPSK
jgi:hypothetical protein